MKYLYVARVYNKWKPGISDKLVVRHGSYSKGNNDIQYTRLYVAVDGYTYHVNNCENYLKRVLLPYLENPKGARNPSEYIDPKFTEIDDKYVSSIIEERITTHPLKIMRLKKKFLPLDRFNLKTVEQGIRNFPDKYLEEVK